MSCSNFYKESVSDKTIFDENLDFHGSSLAKRPSDRDVSDPTADADATTPLWAILLEKGYQGAQRDVRALITEKKPSGNVLSFDQQREKGRISSDRVIVENFYGHFSSALLTITKVQMP
ncbi:hypothetical protein LEN26_008308 [Aphanomyces euteiches]|nr:hypothetical protein AeMF1_010999 [Aphanomyces euteiches]KAH9130668.1 hypothetical protein LEN26_008308 [Aphanomyces euteiches]KAH9187814.1 hypothetical protein AeNC1_010211 [Aphanomyces euteiches]